MNQVPRRAERNGSIFHLPLIISVIVGLVASGAIFLFLESEEAREWIPALVFRYSDDAICRTILSIWICAAIYAGLQYAGLKAERKNVEHFLNCLQNPKGPETMGLSWLGRIICIAAGRPGGNESTYSICRQEGCIQISQDQARILGQDFSDWHYEQAMSDLYVLNFTVWVLPILGFIGTVWGISLSVAGLEQITQANNSGTMAEGLQSGLGQVLAGLATAFDTTFLGLVFAILIMLPQVLLRRKIALQTANYGLLIQLGLPPCTHHMAKQ